MMASLSALRRQSGNDTLFLYTLQRYDSDFVTVSQMNYSPCLQATQPPTRPLSYLSSGCSAAFSPVYVYILRITYMGTQVPGSVGVYELC